METINAIGRRKASVARVYLTKGGGNITINGKELSNYFPMQNIQNSVTEPLKVSELEKQYDIKINVSGGGFKGQAEAIRLGISRALVKIDEENKPALKAKKFLTRDAREVERKKYGKPKARKSFQFSKR
ncbi:30S ribosomal protein S9 [Saprospiraceae bacterium]|jgi:small subunit ribosomal protein S9|nr:30S ribosomal protein S9 [Saprospiraceae bacterium]MDA9866394.1 30S ribosomal protein S9 [Saprospiraceae bacterium]MDB4162259.1 30S ribosomal protein S9 [Saprospiraceae bacterium]MDB9914295.1 30S ribosomal protein S9 [Saprospiraceae bacterium]HCV51300.1 30S ribosomal protein S9 [Saprospirales bacterium]